MADYGIKISQAGFDVGTVADKDTIFTSKGSTPKVLSEGSASVSVGSADAGGPLASQGLTSVAHGLSYAPAYLSFCRIGTQTNRYHANNITGVPAETDYHHFWTYTDGTNINFVVGKNFQASDAGSTCSHSIYYYILADPAE